MFEKARLKLTLWYLIILMTISIVFSFLIFLRTNEEFGRFEIMQKRVLRNLELGYIPKGPGPRFLVFNDEDNEIVSSSRVRFITNLILINLLILIGAGSLSYFLAGKTLKPIKNMMEEQQRFISDSSHEFRTPLTSLRSEIEVALRNKKLSQSEARKILESNLEEVLGLQVLSDNLLELSQNGNFVNKNQMETVSIKEVVVEAIKRIEKIADSKSIKINNKVKDAKLLGIKDRLIEVFVILLDNAIKYSPKKSKVEIVTDLKGQKLNISVIDNGVGIDADDLIKIFDRFYRADKSRSEKGYGLGLSIAKKIVEAHGGLLTVTSLKGTTKFTVSLLV